MAERHEWKYKNTQDGGFVVLCAGCGRLDKVFGSEIEAKIRINHLKRFGNKSESKLNKFFPPRGKFISKSKKVNSMR